ncbi:MAG: helix-turn-helix domain-containing protein [Termitinemataceae bacterium]|nr:MAG: helix-turn-helix domain-containing protein [Termitinemataceae bacterium]
MKSIGDRLKADRESKGLTIEDVARDTNIAKKYIGALENEDFSVFPAEAYLLGFLKNYGDFLGLDVNELQSLYKVLKIQEQPVPVEQLLRTNHNFPKIIVSILIAVVGIVLLGGGAYFIVRSAKGGSAVTGNSKETKKSVEYTLTESSFEKRFFEGDSLVIPVSDSMYKVTLKTLGEVLKLSSPVGEFSLALSDAIQIDINGDGVNELLITASDFEENRKDLGAQVRFELLTSDPQSDEQTALEEEPQNEEAAPTSGSTSSVTLLTGNNPYPFTLQIVFQGYCMFRSERLREANRDRREDYYTKGRELSITANNGVRIWASNAANVRIQVLGGGHTVPIELGSYGEVIVDEIAWKPDGGKYKLVLSRLDM